MQVRVVDFEQLSPQLRSQWSRMQFANPQFASPFFRPEFTEIIATLQKGVRVAIVEDGGQPKGFYPYQEEDRIAHPIGRTLNDFQGFISEAPLDLAPGDFVRQAGLRAWHFDHLITAEGIGEDCRWGEFCSPYTDLSSGFAAYEQERRKSGSKVLQQAARKERKMARELGPLRFEFHECEPGLPDRVIELKRAQYAKEKGVDYLADPWKRAALGQIVQHASDDFCGVLSTLYAGDNLIAAHIGMRSRETFHCWFPTYVEDYAPYSPGQVFWYAFLRACDKQGISRVDWGKGDEQYKLRLMTGSTTVVQGAVDRRPVASLINRNWFRFRERVRHSSLKRPARAIVRNLRWLLRPATPHIF